MNPRSTDMLRTVIGERLDCHPESIPANELAQKIFLYEDHPRPGESWGQQLDRLDVEGMARILKLPKLSKVQAALLLELCNHKRNYAIWHRGVINLIVRDFDDKKVRVAEATLKALSRSGMIQWTFDQIGRRWVEPSFFGRQYIKEKNGG